MGDNMILSNRTTRVRTLGAAMFVVLLVAAPISVTLAEEAASGRRLRVVTTLPDYAWLARQIGGDHVDVDSIAQGNQDPHFVRPRPSYGARMREADLFVTTGLDLELWAPTLLDSTGNRDILEGGKGYVAAWPGVHLLDVPANPSRTEGDVHVYGNPHIHTDPLNMIPIARNILAGFNKVDPARSSEYEEREKKVEERIQRLMFGDELVDLLGGETLVRLAQTGKLFAFLEKKEYPRGSGKKLAERLGGLLQRAAPLRGRRLIGYHKNWAYFADRFDLQMVGYVEPKPGIPPTPRHVETIINLIRDQHIRVILAANYFDPNKPEVIADRTGAIVVTVPISTGGEPGLEDYDALITAWIDRLVAAFAAAGS